MAIGVSTDGDRRRAPRLTAAETAWAEAALLRPGQDVVVINLSPGGVLVESGSRMSPGARAELQLLGESRRAVRGRVERCRVVRLDPVRYQGAIVFDEQLELAARPLRPIERREDGDINSEFAHPRAEGEPFREANRKQHLLGRCAPAGTVRRSL